MGSSCANTAEEDGRHGSNIYEVNMWQWQFGCGKACLGCLTIKETSERKEAASKATDQCGKETSACHNIWNPTHLA